MAWWWREVVAAYIILFRGLHESRPAAEELVNEEIALVGWTMDSWFYHGRWMVMGKLNPDQVDVPYPTYAVGVNGELHATDYKGKVLRPLRPEEEGSLDYQEQPLTDRLSERLLSAPRLSRMGCCRR